MKHLEYNIAFQAEVAQKAGKNLAKWGLQDMETLVLAMQEELGELAQALLKHKSEKGDICNVFAENKDLSALTVQLNEYLERNFPL